MANINVETKLPKGPQTSESLTPAATLNYTRGRFVVYTAGTDGQGCTLQSVAGGDAIGVLEENAVAGLPVRVIESGQAVAEIGATVAAGQFLATDASGRAVPAAAGNNILARALSGNPNAGDFICVQLLNSGAKD